ncbi:MAG: hypothetical protein KAR47_03600 [Planctomycetes bacterium]|nr:hypothetical protein [Planctomycetota bacterium]
MGGSVFGEAKPMAGATVHTTIGLLRKHAATHFFMGLALSSYFQPPFGGIYVDYYGIEDIVVYYIKNAKETGGIRWLRSRA